MNLLLELEIKKKNIKNKNYFFLFIINYMKQFITFKIKISV